MWRVPQELPDLRRVGIVALDTETRDNGLASDHGSGWPTRNGHLCGVSIAYRADGELRGLYFPLRHPDTENFELEQVRRWLTDHVAANLRFVTQNGLYDWDWTWADAEIHMPPSERLEEIGALATMVDENRYRYSLDSLCEWRGLPGKDESLLREGCEALNLITNKRKKFKPQNHLWQLPARYVGPYAEADAVNTLALFESLEPVLDQEGTRAAYRLECDLLPMVLEMRRRGVRIDVDVAEQTRDLLLRKRDAVLAEISDKLGMPVGMAEIGRTKWLAETFDCENIKYPRTEKGNPSFTGGQSGWMDKHPHWLPRLIRQADKYNNAGVNFIGNHILDYTVNGRVHAEIHPHRSEANGTKSFRFSYSNPPLQLMSARDEELASLIRGLFLPEAGEFWCKPDASQQEFRLAVHYAVCHRVPKSEVAQQRFLDDPNTDFHALTAAMTGLARGDAKNVNFAKIYGAGVRKFATMIHKPVAEAQIIFDQYDRELPFLRALSQIYQNIARQKGYITLYDGARRHFNSWVPGGKWQKGAGPCEREEALRRIADPEHVWYRKDPLWRAGIHTALNALIQGSAARHTKLWMRACWREGIVPLLQMHDCLDCSVSTREQGEMVARLCVEAVKLNVPMAVDLKFGRTWGDAKHKWEELHNLDHTQRAADSQHGDGTHPELDPSDLAELPVADGVSATAGTRADPPQSDQNLKAKAPPSQFNGSRVEVPASEITAGVGACLRDIVHDTIGPLLHGKTLCPFHDDHKPSCHIYDDDRSGHFYCFSCHAHGDAIDWLRHTHGLDYVSALETLEYWQPTQRSAPSSDNSTLELALKLWNAAVPILGTLAERYLCERQIDLKQLPLEMLRFHPDCPFITDRRPCLLALFHDIATDAPAGIHRVALNREGKKIGRRMLGRWPDQPRAIKLWPAAGETLVIGEGIETVAAAATRILHNDAPLRPAWAIGSSGGIAGFPVLSGVKRLIVLVDNDPNGAGPNSAKECARRWIAAGGKVELLMPEATGADFNNLARP